MTKPPAEFVDHYWRHPGPLNEAVMSYAQQRCVRAHVVADEFQDGWNAARRMLATAPEPATPDDQGGADGIGNANSDSAADLASLDSLQADTLRLIQRLRGVALYPYERTLVSLWLNRAADTLSTYYVKTIELTAAHAAQPKEYCMSSPSPAEHAAFASLPINPILRAKMRVESVTVNKNADGTLGSERVRLVAVYGGSEENKLFAKYTPSASLDIHIDNPAAQGHLSQGHEYYVDFTPAVRMNDGTTAA